MTLEWKNFVFRDEKCFLLTLIDMTAIVLLREEQQRAEQEHHRAELMKQIQASVSHNIRAPIETVTMICKSLIQKRMDFDIMQEEVQQPEKTDDQ